MSYLCLLGQVWRGPANDTAAGSAGAVVVIALVVGVGWYGAKWLAKQSKKHKDDGSSDPDE
jgi:hypothetical protein